MQTSEDSRFLSVASATRLFVVLLPPSYLVLDHSVYHKAFSRESCSLSTGSLGCRLPTSYAPTFSTMNPRELVDHIRSGPTEIVLEEPLRFRRRTRSNPCDFNEFLQALQSSETIRSVQCASYLELEISEDDWVLLVKTIGRITDIKNLNLCCTNGSRDFVPFWAITEALKSAHSLCELRIDLPCVTTTGDPSGLTALANALREHKVLQEFIWADLCARPEAAQIAALDHVIRALPACPHLRSVTIITKSASAGAITNLLQLPKATKLSLNVKTDVWLAVTDEIRRGHCNVQVLALFLLEGTPPFEAIEAAQAVASVIQLDRNLKILSLGMGNVLTDEAGVALAEALTVNKTLHGIILVFPADASTLPNTPALGVPVYEALSAMLRVNTSLVLRIHPSESDGANERLRESRDQLRIEQRLNTVGRGRLLASNQTTREQWADAVHELASGNVDDSPAFQVSCIYSVLRSSPTVVRMS
jgi:hypothetical protein